MGPSNSAKIIQPDKSLIDIKASIRIANPSSRELIRKPMPQVILMLYA